MALPLLVLASLLSMSSASAGMTYQLSSAHASAGETVQIKGLLFNDTDTALNSTPPKNLVLQWRNEQGQAIRSLAYLNSNPSPVSVPVNNFVGFSWRAVVPTGVKGLMAVSIEGDSILLALDTSPREQGPVAGTPADVPIIDAGAAKAGQRTDPLLPHTVVAATGASATEGPAVASAAPFIAAPTVFENFRNSISPYEATYFDVGGRGGTNARFQVSFKYRLSTPEDPENPTFKDNLYLGYTQTALWDLAGESMPFVDTTYNPSFFWKKDKLWESAKNPWFVGLNTGVEHKSNGKSSPDSRSHNDAYVQPELNYRFEGGSTLTFAPRIKGYFAEDPGENYAAYLGHVDWKLRWEQDNGLILTGLYRQGQKGRTSTQLEAAWPLKRTFLNMNGYVHLQFMKGYGETLLNYDKNSSSQVRLGLALVP